MNNLIKVLKDEQKFPYENMSSEERNQYLNILKNCKDISDSMYPVNGERQCHFVEMKLKKSDNQILLNGSLTIGSQENRCIDGCIFVEKSRIMVDTHITRLSNEGAFLEYTVLDEFKIIDEKLVRNSYYNHDMKTITSEISDEVAKGMIK